MPVAGEDDFVASLRATDKVRQLAPGLGHGHLRWPERDTPCRRSSRETEGQRQQGAGQLSLAEQLDRATIVLTV